MGSIGTLLLLLTAIADQTVAIGEMKEQVIYNLPFGGSGFCIRLLNATHQVGCGSSMNGDEGVLVHVRTAVDVQGAADGWKERFPDYDGGFVVLMDELLLDGSTAPLLMSAPRVNGVLLMPAGESEKIDKNVPRSAEAACPNRQTSLYSDWRACGSTPSKQWNGQGAMLEQGMRFTDWPKPMTRILNDTVRATMIKCHDEYNLPNGDTKEGRDEGRRCAVSMKTFMQASSSSVECMRRQAGSISDYLVTSSRQLCDPMLDYNIFAILPPGVQNKTAGGGYLAIITRMDGVAMIPDASPAALGTMSAVITALTAAKVVGDNLATFEAASKKSDKRIIFAFLHGESFDYVGSSRWVYDMEHGAFPNRKKVEGNEDIPERITMDRISLAVELQQIDDSTQFHAHVDGKNYDVDEKGKIKKALETMSAAMGGVKVDTSRVNSKGVLPPSSLHSILKRRRQTPSLLLTSFGDQYSNRRLHSSYDRLTGGAKEEKAVKESIEKVAKGMVAMLAEHVGLNETARASLAIDTEWLETLSTCFIASSKMPECDYLQKLYERTVNNPLDRSTFISAEATSIIRNLIARLMTITTGEHESTTNVRDKESCKHVDDNQALYNYGWQLDPMKNDSYCYRTSIYASIAKSPAFIPDENSLIHLADSNYSTWVEARMAIIADYHLFLVESKPVDYLMMMAGLLTTLVALLIVGRCDDSSFIVDEGERAAEEGEPL